MPEKKPRVLLVDDESAITNNLSPFLERAGFEVGVAEDGEAALTRMADYPPDLLVLDVLMPRLDGREVLRRMRSAGNWTPVILLTQVGESSERAMALEEGADDYLNKPYDPHELVARIRAVLRRMRSAGNWTPVILLTQVGESSERAMALEEGADDYLNKPYDPHELVARIRAVLRRARPGQPPLAAATRLASGDLLFDRRTLRAWLAGQELTLTPKALTLLDYLLTHPDELLSRERLLDVVWGWDYPVGTRAVDTRVAELRRALKDDPDNPTFIDTAPGHGYRFVGEVRPHSGD